jgi:hypothetical protein
LSADTSAMDRLRELGGKLFLDGERQRYRIPARNAEACRILEELRRNRDAVAEMLREQQSNPPTLDEVKAMLPPSVRLVSYRPKEVPFSVAPVSIVTNAGKFYRAYLADLARRIEKPDGYHCPPLADILGKLADAGLQLDIQAREGS